MEKEMEKEKEKEMARQKAIGERERGGEIAEVDERKTKKKAMLLSRTANGWLPFIFLQLSYFI